MKHSQDKNGLSSRVQKSRLYSHANESRLRFLLLLREKSPILKWTIDEINREDKGAEQFFRTVPAAFIALPLGFVIILKVIWDLIFTYVTLSASAISVVSKAPGSRFLKFVDFLFSPKTVELTFRPLIADWQSEYFEALNQGRKYKARWITFRYRFAFARTFIMALGLSKVFSMFKQLSK